MSPDASVVYFAYEGRLLAQDASRSGSGIYESRDGTVSEAGVLPDGSVPASGAIAGRPSDRIELRKGIQAGRKQSRLRLTTSSPKMASVCCSSPSGELYVHKIEADGSERSVLGVGLAVARACRRSGRRTESPCLKTGPKSA